MATGKYLSLVCLLFAAACFYESRRLWSGWGGAGLLPAIIMVVLVGLAVVFFLARKVDEQPLALPDFGQLRVAGVVAVAFAAYIGLADVLGYLLSTWLVLFVITAATSQAGVAVAIVWPGFLAAGSFYLFKLVGTHLPTGPLGI